MLVISCHADTNFQSHSLTRSADGRIYGHLDNFAGVHAVMRAYFSGRLAGGHVRIALTHGEEVDFAGAREVLPTLRPEDLLLVVDVTGVEVEADLTIEKCEQPDLRNWLTQTLAGLRVAIYEDCPDPVADSDETDVYALRCPFNCFLGVMCSGGDYNAGPVDSRESAIEAAAEAICRVAEAYAEWERVRPTLVNPQAAQLELTVQSMHAKDRGDWLRLRNLLWPGPTAAHAAEIDSYLQQPDADSHAWIARDLQGVALGFAEASSRDFAEGCTSSPVAYLEGIYVAASQRRRGVARKLLAAVEQWAKAQGYRELGSDTESFNIESEAVHRRLGFVVAEQLICFRKPL